MSMPLQAIAKHPESWVLCRSPLTRTATTAAPYVECLRAAGAAVPDPTVDPMTIEINQVWGMQPFDHCCV